MIKLTGAEAQRYADHQLEDNNARGYERVRSFFCAK